jgi:hypothetical protein
MFLPMIVPIQNILKFIQPFHSQLVNGLLLHTNAFLGMQNTTASRQINKFPIFLEHPI